MYVDEQNVYLRENSLKPRLESFPISNLWLTLMKTLEYIELMG